MVVGHWWELIIILFLVVLVFGVGRLSDLGGALGKSIREFKSSVREDDSTSSKS
jgi:sec-independent protein translocase protein TatA